MLCEYSTFSLSHEFTVRKMMRLLYRKIYLVRALAKSRVSSLVRFRSKIHRTIPLNKAVQIAPRHPEITREISLRRHTKSSRVELNSFSALYEKVSCWEFSKHFKRESQKFDHNFYSKIPFRAQPRPLSTRKTFQSGI